MLKNFTVIDILNTRSDSVVNFHGNTLRFNPQTAEELGYPQYVEVLVNPKGKQFAIRPCEAGAKMAVSFCKGKERKKITITNTIIAGVLRKMVAWDPDESWNMAGVYDAEENALAYSLNAAFEPKDPHGGWKARKAKEAAQAKETEE